MTTTHAVPKISPDQLRQEIKNEYTNVALDSTKGYHFHTGRAGREAKVSVWPRKL